METPPIDQQYFINRFYVKIEKYLIQGQDLKLETAVVLPPPIVSPFGAHRWLEEYQNPPWNRKYQRRCRLTLFDGVLQGLRALRDVALTALIAQGEGAVGATAMLNQDIRKAAYQERQVSVEEQKELEEDFLLGQFY